MSQLDVLIKQINKQEKMQIVSKGVEQKNYAKIPFSSPLLNYMTYGGLPRGTVIEFAGEENGGKTTTALDVVANAQKLFKSEFEKEWETLGAPVDPKDKRMQAKQQDDLKILQERGVKKVVYCDCENTLDKEWAEKLGVNTDEMILLKPMAQSAEEIFEMLLQMMETGEVGLVVIDSLGVMVSQQAYDKDVTEKTYGGIAAALTLFGKKAQMICARNDCTLLGINQIREDMSGFNRIITTGGKGWKHLCSFRFIFKKGDFLDENNNSIKRSSTSPAGNLIEIAIVKDKVVKPDRLNGYYTLKYDEGVDILNDTVELACFYDIIQKGGAWYSIIDIETGEIMGEKTSTTDGDTIEQFKFQGKPALLDFLRNRPDIFNLIYKEVMEKLEE